MSKLKNMLSLAILSLSSLSSCSRDPIGESIMQIGYEKVPFYVLAKPMGTNLDDALTVRTEKILSYKDIDKGKWKGKMPVFYVDKNEDKYKDLIYFDRETKKVKYGNSDGTFSKAEIEK